MVRLLLEYGAKVDSRDPRGNIPLHTACTGGHVSIVRVLLEAGANPNERDMTTRVSLHWMACEGNTEVSFQANRIGDRSRRPGGGAGRGRGEGGGGGLLICCLPESCDPWTWVLFETEQGKRGGGVLFYLPKSYHVNTADSSLFTTPEYLVICTYIFAVETHHQAQSEFGGYVGHTKLGWVGVGLESI